MNKTQRQKQGKYKLGEIANILGVTNCNLRYHVTNGYIEGVAKKQFYSVSDIKRIKEYWEARQLHQRQKDLTPVL